MLKRYKKFKKYVKETPKKGIIRIFRFFLLLEIISGAALIYYLSLLNGIEDVIRYIAMVFIILIMIGFINKHMKVLMKEKKKIRSRIFHIILILLVTIGQGYACYAIDNIYKPIDNINKSTITYTSVLLTMNDSNIEEVDDLSKSKIGYIDSDTALEDNKIALSIIDENKLKKNNDVKEYEQYFDMISDLYSGKIDAIIITDKYVTMFSSIDGYENIQTDTKVILEKSMEFKKKNSKTVSSKNIVNEPFTVLLMGVDSEKDGLNADAAFNGDSLMLITFNPKTLNTTVLSIPRDTYVPIACFRNQKRNKITHAAWQGVDCVEKTIENMTGIQIDYYVKMNFKGVVSLVDALGGIDVDVPIKFCEQDSNRWGGASEICLNKGEQTINGEAALALARHRKTLERGDIQRGLNQQLVVEGMLKKLTNINSVEKVNSILSAISKNMDTNITTNQILSFYNVGKDILLRSTHTSTADLISMEQLFINGYDKMIYDPDFDLTLYNYVPYQSSITAVSNAMKENLGIKNTDTVKTFDFSINEVYEKKIIGENVSDNKSSVSDGLSDKKTKDTDSKKDDSTTTKEKDEKVMPNLIGRTKSYADAILSSYNVKYEFISIEKGNPLYKDTYSNGEIIAQSVDTGTSLTNVKSITLKYIVKSTSNTTDDTTKKDDDEIDPNIKDIVDPNNNTNNNGSGNNGNSNTNNNNNNDKDNTSSSSNNDNSSNKNSDNENNDDNN